MPQRNKSRRTEFDKAKETVCELISQHERTYSSHARTATEVGRIASARIAVTRSLAEQASIRSAEASVIWAIGGALNNAAYSCTQDPIYRHAVEVLERYKNRSKHASQFLKRVYELIPGLEPQKTVGCR